MFGRRTTEILPPAPTPPEDDFDLSMLPDELPPPLSIPTLNDLLNPERRDEPARTSAPPNIPEPTPFVPLDSAVTAATRPRATTESVIGPDDFFDGNYRSERGVRIQGNVKGAIESRQYIFVEASAQVEASLSAEDITVSGHFNGTIECRRRLEVTSSGQVQGHIRTALLVVQEGGVLHGQLEMRVADEHTPAAAGS